MSQMRRTNLKAGRSKPVVLVTTVFTAFGWASRKQNFPTSRHFPLTAVMEKLPLFRIFLDCLNYHIC